MRTLKIIVPLFLAFGLHACGELVAGNSVPMAQGPALEQVASSPLQNTIPR